MNYSLSPVPSKTAQGFILSRHRREVSGKLFLEYWLTTDSGPVKLITDVQSEVFFALRSDDVKIKNLLNQLRIPFQIKLLMLKNFQRDDVIGLYFDRASSAYKAKEVLEKNNIVTYESDIRLTERFLMERFVCGSAEYNGIPQCINGQNSITQAQIRPSDYIPKFKIVSLDVECSEKGELYSIGLDSRGDTDEKLKAVIMIGPGVNEPGETEKDWIIWVKDEKSLLQELINQIDRFDPDIFVGWNVVNFDFRLLVKRAEVHSIPLTLGRDQEPIKWRDARGDTDQGYVTIAGRTIIDGIDALKTATYLFDSFSLESVSQNILGKGKKTEDVHNRMSEINHNFKYDKIKLAEYNLQDCILVNEIFDRTNLLAFLTLRSRITGLELDRSGGSVAAFLNLYLPKLHRAGYVSPNRPEDGGLASPGGYVMDSHPGLYSHVLVLDFKSLYPSIIRTFKIDPMGLVEGLNAPDNAIPGYKGALFSRDKHFLPDIITSLWEQRDEAKKKSDEPRSQAIKILMNSFYGVLGSGGCPFYDTRLASSITMRGHDIMQTTAKWIEEMGYKVIYGDTDSTFVWLDSELPNSEAKKVGEKIQSSINKKWNKKISEDYALENTLEIEFETHFSRFLMPTIRGSNLGSKKRYAGIKTTRDGEELVFKGLETVRSDWTPLAKEFQYRLYSLVFADENVEEYIQSFIASTRNGEFDDLLVYRKRLKRRLDRYIKNVPPHVRAARIADEKNKQLGREQQYQNRGWISYVITLSGPEPHEYIASRIDYDHYIEKQIRPIAEAILPFINMSFSEITSDQLGLF